MEPIVRTGSFLLLTDGRRDDVIHPTNNYSDSTIKTRPLISPITGRACVAFELYSHLHVIWGILNGCTHIRQLQP